MVDISVKSICSGFKVGAFKFNYIEADLIMLKDNCSQEIFMGITSYIILYALSAITKK